MEEELQYTTAVLSGLSAAAATASVGSPQNGLLVRQLAEAIEESIANHVTANAVFLSERLLAEHDSEETRGILAESYLAESKHYKVFEILRHCKSEMNRYRFAIACLKLNKYEEGERALLQEHYVMPSDMSIQQKLKGQLLVESIPNGSYGFFLLGQILEAKQKQEDAKNYYVRALELNPTLWAAYEKLCKIGDQQILPYKFFCETRYKQYVAAKRTAVSRPACSIFTKGAKDSTKQVDENDEQPQQHLQQQLPQQQQPARLNQPVTRFMSSSGLTRDSLILGRNIASSSATAKWASSLQTTGVVASQVPATASLTAAPAVAGRADSSSRNSSAKRRKPSKFEVPTGSSSSSNSSSSVSHSFAPSSYDLPPSFSTNNRPPSHAQESQLPVPSSSTDNQAFARAFHQQPHSSYLSGSQFEGGSSQSQHGIRDISTLLNRLGEAYFHMSLYFCKEAIDLFNNLPRQHFNTGWVLTSIGRCYMEIVKYSEAEKYYAEALRIEPYRLEGIEYYSSCLWHLKKQVELAYLAQQALEKSLAAPETWIAVGNCFSLQKDHENALKFFQRAIQLNQTSAYAYSLCGHEFVCNEDFARAKKSFSQALNFDMRNYNAYWGLGNIFYKQEKYSRAAEHFLKAININQKNPVLFSFMGMSLAADRKYKKALDYFEASEKLDPRNGLNKFQKANTLVKLENFEGALKQLHELHLMMPKESPIPMLMGKVYKKLKKTDLALKYFTDALDLENKDSQRIKALIESLHQDNHDFVEDLDL